LGAVHAFPQAPQSVRVLSRVSQPLDTSPSQSSNPAQHLVSAHFPSTQLAEPFGYAHARPHIPQSVNVDSEVSQPSSELELQSARPGEQRNSEHTPPAHDRPKHTCPQPPQLSSVSNPASHPFERLLSQLS
jgi:hypothetical protein